MRPDTPPCVDTHVHLDLYPVPVVVDLVRRAVERAVVIVSVSVDVASAERNVGLTRRFPGAVFACVGWHPLHLRAEPTPDDWHRLAELARDERVLAIGEVGLDFGGAAAPGAVQLATLRRALDLALTLDLPVALHLPPGGDEDAAARDLLTDADFPAERVLIHYFTGDARRAAAWLGVGARLAFGKPITRPAEVATRDAARATPLARCLLETDSYPLPGRTTTPADVCAVAAALAELHGLAEAEVVRATTANAAAFFPRRAFAEALGG